MEAGSEKRDKDRKPIKHFRDLIVYQEGLRLVVRLYACCEALPMRERLGLESQIKRAALSVVLNIAEGYGRKSSEKEFQQYLRTSLGSCNEVIACLDVAVALGYLSNEANALAQEYERLARQLWSLARKWQRYPDSHEE